MVQKPERGRYLTLEDVRVSYKPKDDTIHLTSSDPEIPQGSFYLTLNRGTTTEEALRELLVEHELIKIPAPQLPVTDEQEKLSCGNTLSEARNPIYEILASMHYDHNQLPQHMAITGQPGSGTTTALKTIADIAQKLGITVYSMTKKYELVEQQSTIDLKDLAKVLTPSNLGITSQELIPWLVRLSSKEWFSGYHSEMVADVITEEFRKHQTSPQLPWFTDETIDKQEFSLQIPLRNLRQQLDILKEQTGINLLDRRTTLESASIAASSQQHYNIEQLTKTLPKEFVPIIEMLLFKNLLRQIQHTEANIFIIDDVNILDYELNNILRLSRSLRLLVAYTATEKSIERNKEWVRHHFRYQEQSGKNDGKYADIVKELPIDTALWVDTKENTQYLARIETPKR